MVTPSLVRGLAEPLPGRMPVTSPLRAMAPGSDLSYFFVSMLTSAVPSVAKTSSQALFLSLAYSLVK